MYPVMTNDRVKNSSQETHAVTPHIEFEHINGRENILVDSLPRLWSLGLHDDYDLQKPDQEYGKSILIWMKTQ